MEHSFPKKQNIPEQKTTGNNTFQSKAGLQDQRPQLAQLQQLQSQADQRTSQDQVAQLQGMANSVNFLHSDPTSTSGIIQRKEVTTLQPGSFNMIGESHSDYKDRDARGVESSKIKSVMGPSAQYYTESMLKVDSSDQDDADPIYLRLEQVFAFILNGSADFIAKMKAIDPTELQKSTDQTGQLKLEAKAIAKEVAPLIETDEFKLDVVIKAILSKSPSKALMVQLESYDSWEVEETYDSNLDAVLDKIIELELDMSDEASTSKSGSSEDLFAKAMGLIHGDFFKFYDTYKGRLPHTLKLYYALKKSKHVTTEFSRFNFDIATIKPLIEEWDKIEELRGLIIEAMMERRIDLVPLIIETLTARLNKLVATIHDGHIGFGRLGFTNVVRIHRSIVMDRAAEARKGDNIAWKVGNLHIEDVKRLEAKGKINTGYSYISKENFLSSIEHVPQANESAETDEKLGAHFTETEAANKSIVRGVDEDLASGK